MRTIGEEPIPVNGTQMTQMTQKNPLSNKKLSEMEIQRNMNLFHSIKPKKSNKQVLYSTFQEFSNLSEKRRFEQGVQQLFKLNDVVSSFKSDLIRQKCIIESYLKRTLEIDYISDEQICEMIDLLNMKKEKLIDLYDKDLSLKENLHTLLAFGSKQNTARQQTFSSTGYSRTLIRGAPPSTSGYGSTGTLGLNGGTFLSSPQQVVFGKKKKSGAPCRCSRSSPHHCWLTPSAAS